jgi:hypothetical protein
LKLTQEQIERQTIEYLFGDLDDPWRDADGVVRFGYSYDGAPEWATEYTSDYDNRYATGIVTGGGFLPSPPEVISDPDGGTWHLVETFAHSGEKECPLSEGYPAGKVQADHCNGPDDSVCPFCEEPIGADHGFVYVGDSYEAVYRYAPKTVRFAVCTLDVWGNADDGFEVNDSHKAGTVDLPVDAEDEDVWRILCESGFAKGPYERAEFDWADESYCTISDSEDGRPVFNLIAERD